jgi:hypothetical protein
MNFANQSMALEIIDNSNSNSGDGFSNKDLYYSRAPVEKKKLKKPKKTRSNKELLRES